jgi:hypothetical protein
MLPVLILVTAANATRHPTTIDKEIATGLWR